MRLIKWVTGSDILNSWGKEMLLTSGCANGLCVRLGDEFRVDSNKGVHLPSWAEAKSPLNALPPFGGKVVRRTDDHRLESRPLTQCRGADRLVWCGACKYLADWHQPILQLLHLGQARDYVAQSQWVGCGPHSHVRLRWCRKSRLTTWRDVIRIADNFADPTWRRQDAQHRLRRSADHLAECRCGLHALRKVDARLSEGLLDAHSRTEALTGRVVQGSEAAQDFQRRW